MAIGPTLATKYDLVDLLETPLTFSGVDINNAGSSEEYLPNEVAFPQDTFRLNTQADGLGTNITGFDFVDESKELSDVWGKRVYKKIRVTDPTYQTGHIYAFGNIAGSIIIADDVNRLQTQISGLVGAYPIGSFYIQFPDAESNNDSVEFPTAYRPATLFGGTWTEEWSTEAVYFRTRGTLSDTGRTNGKQEDALQGFKCASTDILTYETKVLAAGSSYEWGHTTGLPVTDSIHGVPRIESETRTVNRRIKVWKRTA